MTRAARHLGLSQSATSHALAPARAAPRSAAGAQRARTRAHAQSAALLPQLARGLDELQATLRGQERFDPRRAGLSMRVGAADYPQAILSPSLLGLLRTEAPGVGLQLTSYHDLREQL